MRELLGDSEFGLVVDNSEEALCGGLRQMITDKEMRTYYAAQASLRGSSFSARSLTAKTENYFEVLQTESLKKRL